LVVGGSSLTPPDDERDPETTQEFCTKKIEEEVKTTGGIKYPDPKLIESEVYLLDSHVAGGLRKNVGRWE